jgi:nicotinamidase-related amidase
MKGTLKMAKHGTVVHVLVIDPQNSFCSPKGSLYAPGADADMDRLAAMVTRVAPKIDDIKVTLDSHRIVDISHPIWWQDRSGKHPNPFTVISVQDVESGVWVTTQPGALKRSLEYLRALETGGKYPHVIWPEHCIIGDEGHNVWPALAEAIHGWERTRFAMRDYVTKGSNPWTEHFSAVQAEVPDPEDPSTQVNTGLIQSLETADIIALAGEALSHCLRSSVTDVVRNFSAPQYIEKMVLITDASSNVPTFETHGATFIKEMRSKGMKTATTTDFLA